MEVARFVSFAMVVYLSFKVINPTPVLTEAERKSFRKEIAHQLGNRGANEQFADCCENSPVGPSCRGMCNFDLLSKNKIILVLTSKSCSPATMLYCAASGESHMNCCRKKNVHVTGNTKMDQCLDFCDLSPGKNVKIGYGHLPCWAKLDLIKDCFQEYMTNLPLGCDRIRRSEGNC